MKNQIPESIQGQVLTIDEIRVMTVANTMNLHMAIRVNRHPGKLAFFNVSCLHICDLSAPMTIQGFEILCNSERGWDTASAYTIHDFEDDRIRFSCESFDVSFPAENP